MKFDIFIGFDQREAIAAEVCKFSIEENLSIEDKPNITFLKSENIPEFTRPREARQSTDFTYTRFMIPFIKRYKGYSLFCDCDFLFLVDINQIWKYVENKDKAVFVVHHPSYMPNTSKKMDGVVQHFMPKKNWASLIIFNNAHPSCQKLTPDYINTVMPGRSLHQFEWANDKEVGYLPFEWNALDDYYLLENPKAIHYTDGGPWFENYKHTMYSHLWWKYYDKYVKSRGIPRTLSPNT